MTKEEEFNQKLKEITNEELAEMASDAIQKMCESGGRSFTMCVPVQLTDTDIILSELVKRFNAASNMDNTHLLMQYYFEYCQKNGYVTPQDWIANHKHF